MTKQELWAKNLEFYQELVTKYKWKQEPMIKLIRYFEEVGICNKYFPSNSHESLGLSTTEDHEERLLLPMVYITYQAKTKNFLVVFQKGQGKTVSQEACKSIFDDLIIKKIHNWLSEEAEF